MTPQAILLFKVSSLCYYPYTKGDIFNTERRGGNEK